MPKGAIARRYAGAMFDIGLKQHSLERTLEDVRGIAQVFAHRKLAYLLREPKVPAQRKETAIRQALANKLLPTSLNLALLVVQRELVDIMPNIANELEQLVLNYKNEAIADVTTATRIDDAELTQIKQALEKRTGKTISALTRKRCGRSNLVHHATATAAERPNPRLPRELVRGLAPQRTLRR